MRLHRLRPRRMARAAARCAATAAMVPPAAAPTAAALVSSRRSQLRSLRPARGSTGAAASRMGGGVALLLAGALLCSLCPTGGRGVATCRHQRCRVCRTAAQLQSVPAAAEAAAALNALPPALNCKSNPLPAVTMRRSSCQPQHGACLLQRPVRGRLRWLHAARRRCEGMPPGAACRSRCTPLQRACLPWVSSGSVSACCG